MRRNKEGSSEMDIGPHGTKKIATERLGVLIFCRGVGVVNRGAERATEDLAAALQAHHDVHIVSYGQKDPDYQASRSSDFGWMNRLPNLLLLALEIIRISPINLEAIRFSIRAIKVVRRFNPHIVISTGGPWEILILRLLRRNLSFKIISIGHGGYGIERQQVGASPNFHVTLSNFSERKLLDLKRKVAIQKIPNMVDSRLFKSARGGVVSPSKRKIPVVLIVAAAVDYKNIDITMKAVAQAGFNLIWCGDGPLRDQLTALANTLFEEDAFRWITVPLEEMPQVYLEADIFTLVSERNVEAYGLVYLEAMACGLRCVVTDDEIRREACGDEGIFIDPNDISQYVAALRLAWEKTREFGPLEWAPGPHSIEAVTESFLGLFERAVRT